MTARAATAVAAGAIVLAVAGGGAATQLDALSSSTETVTVLQAPTPPGCNDWPVQLTTGECQAAGVIRYVALYNLQGAAQFCKWRGANPGEWSRLNGYAGSGVAPVNIVTWFGGSIENELEAYFATGAPVMTWVVDERSPGDPSDDVIAPGIQPNTAPNACTGKLVKPPVVTGVTPGQTDATVTITTTP